MDTEQLKTEILWLLQRLDDCALLRVWSLCNRLFVTQRKKE